MTDTMRLRRSLMGGITHYELVDYFWFVIIVCSISSGAAADEDFDTCHLRRIAHWSRFVLLVTIVITQGDTSVLVREVRVEKK